MKVRATIFLVVVFIVGGLLWVGGGLWERRVWYAAQSQQLATIRRLGEFPPPGWEASTWRNAIITPYNVWGNVTYSPAYSQISIAEMRLLQSELDEILAETTVVNSRESVDRAFALLLRRGRKVDFISGFREEFRSYGSNLPMQSAASQQLTPSVPVAAPMINHAQK